MQKVLVYRGEGAGWRSVRSAHESVERLLAGPLLRPLLPQQRLEVDTLSAAELLDGGWTQQAALLVMPGGADLPYCRHLNGRGNAIIKEFVNGGGSYLGLCAGAYYASAVVVFEAGSPLEVVGDRELAFFPGTARGAAFPGFDYRTEAGSVAAPVEFRVPRELQEIFQQQQQHEQEQPRHVSGLLSPTPQHTVATAYDYCNGGPFFVDMDGSADIEQLPGVTVLAMYCPSACSSSTASNGQGAAQQATAAAAVNGGAQTQQELISQPPQQQQQRRVAAVRCRVGKGVAVLCGTHPELGPEWLDPCGESNAAEGPQPHEPAPTGAAAVGVGAVGVSSGDASKLLQQQQQHGSVSSAAAGGVQVLQQAIPRGDGSSSSGMEQPLLVPVVCKDVALAAHAQQLQRQLRASQCERDLLLSSLLYEALVLRPHTV